MAATQKKEKFAELVEKIKKEVNRISGTTVLCDQDFDDLDDGFEGYKIQNTHDHGHALLIKKLTDGSEVIDVLIFGENSDAVILNVSDWDDANHFFNCLCLTV